jgi:hypothetical protein
VIRALIASRRRQLACVKLARMVESNRNSFRIQDFKRRRDAMLRATRV